MTSSRVRGTPYAEKNDKQWNPFFYYSKRTTYGKSRYHNFELETLAIINALKRFRVYLEGIPFTFVTDRNSLTLTFKNKQINPRKARWALELENYEYEIVHHENTRMRHVDALSRNTNEILVAGPMSFEQVIAVEQGRDPIIVDLKKKLETEQITSFELQDGLVYRKTSDEKLLFYVSNGIINNVIRSCQDDMGHFGVDKVCHIIQQLNWFPKMAEKVSEYIPI